MRDVTETNGETRNDSQSTGNPKQNAVASTHALEFIHGVYSLELMNSYHLFAANSFSKIHKWVMACLVFEKPQISYYVNQMC